MQILPGGLLGVSFVQHSADSWDQQHWLWKPTFLGQGLLQLGGEGTDNLGGCSILGRWPEWEGPATTDLLNSAFFISAEVLFPTNLGTETFSTQAYLTFLQVYSQTLLRIRRPELSVP